MARTGGKEPGVMKTKKTPRRHKKKAKSPQRLGQGSQEDRTTRQKKAKDKGMRTKKKSKAGVVKDQSSGGSSAERSGGERSDSAESFDMPETDDEWLPSHQPPMTSAAAAEAHGSKRKRRPEVSDRSNRGDTGPSGDGGNGSTSNGISGSGSGSNGKSGKRAREGDELVGFLEDSQSAEVVEVGDLEEKEPLNWARTIFSTSTNSTSAATSYVADLPRRPGHVAVRSASVKGKGDLVIVVQESHYGEAVELFHRRHDLDWPATADGVEGDPRLGVLPDENGAPSFQCATRSDAITAIIQTKQPYGDELHKFLALATLFRWETPGMQQTMDAAVPEVQLPQNAQYFVDAHGNALPKMAVRKVHDTGGGANVDYSAGGVVSDPMALLAFGGGTIGGAQNGASRIVALGSAEDSRLHTDAVAATTNTDSMIVVRLYDAVVLAARGKTLYKIGSWLSDNVVGIAKVDGRRGVSLVETKKGKTRGGEPWVWLVTVIDNWEHCWPGPFYVVMVTGEFCFSGYKNLKKHDKEGARQMEVGRSGDVSTPATKGKTGGKADFQEGEKTTAGTMSRGTRKGKAEGGKTGGKADYAEGATTASGRVSKGTSKGRAGGGKADYAEGATTASGRVSKGTSKGKAGGGTNGDRQKKAVAGGKSRGNRRGSEVPFASRLQQIPGVALYCDGCGHDWRYFSRSRGVARGCVNEDKAVVTVVQEKHWKCNSKRCKPAAGAKVRIGGVEYTVESAQDGQFRAQGV